MTYLAEHLRLINCILAGLCVAAMTFGMVIRRHSMPRRIRRISAWVFLIILNIAYGSGYLYSNGNDVNPPAVTMLLVLCGLGIAMIWHPEGDELTPPHDGALTNRFMLWFDGRVRRYKAEHTRNQEDQ